MEKKTKIDAFGAIALIAFSLLLGINHVVIKIVNLGLNPIFFAGIRSFIAFFFIIFWMRLANKPIVFNKENFKISLIAGVIFAFEFLFLFLALDFTSVSRNSIIYYSMPLWLTILLFFTKSNERNSFLKSLGLILAFTGVVISVTNFEFKLISNSTNFIGDILAFLAALFWAILIIIAKNSNFSKVLPEMQLLWMVMVSAPILTIFSIFIEEPIRDFEIIHIWGVLFQSIIVVAGGFLFWLWLLARYPASGVASFSFLTPIFTIFFGWLILGEVITTNFLIAAFLVISGLILINK
ncbi:MAG: DMT family transporter [Paracoccaceae bacterium]